MRTPDQKHAEWVVKFDEERTPEEWAEFMYGVDDQELLTLAFQMQAKHIWACATRLLEQYQEQERSIVPHMSQRIAKDGE